MTCVVQKPPGAVSKWCAAAFGSVQVGRLQWFPNRSQQFWITPCWHCFWSPSRQKVNQKWNVDLRNYRIKMKCISFKKCISFYSFFMSLFLSYYFFSNCLSGTNHYLWQSTDLWLLHLMHFTNKLLVYFIYCGIVLCNLLLFAISK